MANEYDRAETQEEPIVDRKVIERLVKLEVNSELTYKTTNELKENYKKQSKQLCEVISGMNMISSKMDDVINAQNDLSKQLQTEVMPTINKYKENEKFFSTLNKLMGNKLMVAIFILLIILASNESLWNFVETTFFK